LEEEDPPTPSDLFFDYGIFLLWRKDKEEMDVR
jgi:hypothetical protein